MKLFDVSLDNSKIRKAVDEFQDIPFDGTFNVIVVNGILEHDNLYSFVLKLNREQGLKINVVDENTKLTNGKTVKDYIYYVNGNYIKESIDYLRLMLICDFGYNNFIDLDLLINSKMPFDWINLLHNEKNYSGILGHNKLTKYEYEVFKNKNLLFVNKQPVKIMHDELYYMPVELRQKYKNYLNTNLCYKLISNIIIFSTFYLKSTKNNLVIVCENYDEKLFKLFDKYNDLYNVEIMKPECLKSKENMINWNYGDLIENK